MSDAEFAKTGGLTKAEITREERFLDNIKRSLKKLQPFLDDPTVTDIYRNPDGKVYVKAFGRKKEQPLIMSSAETKMFANFVASILGNVIDSRNTGFSGVIPYYDARVEITGFPDVTSTTFAIRKKPSTVYTLENYVESRRLSTSHMAFLEEMIRTRQNIIVAGSTGSGKTTLVNAIIEKVSQLTPDDRLYIVEDTGELQCSARDHVVMVVPTERAKEAVHRALRYFPRRIFFGELRQPDSVDALIESWNTGHSGGSATIHSDDGVSALYRIRAKLHDAGVENGGSKINQSIRCVVFIKNVEEGGRGPVITEVLRVLPRMDPKSTGRFLVEKVGRSILEEEAGISPRMPETSAQVSIVQRFVHEHMVHVPDGAGGSTTAFIDKEKLIEFLKTAT